MGSCLSLAGRLILCSWLPPGYCFFFCQYFPSCSRLQDGSLHISISFHWVQTCSNFVCIDRMTCFYGPTGVTLPRLRVGGAQPQQIILSTGIKAFALSLLEFECLGELLNSINESNKRVWFRSCWGQIEKWFESVDVWKIMQHAACTWVLSYRYAWLWINHTDYRAVICRDYKWYYLVQSLG